MNYAKLKSYPLGSITAEGFLREQLMKNKDGMGGHLDELEPGVIRDPFINRTHVGGWTDVDQAGWGAEISGNYWSGLIELAFSLNDKELIEKVTNWVDTMMKYQREDGYLGTYTTDMLEDYNA